MIIYNINLTAFNSVKTDVTPSTEEKSLFPNLPDCTLIFPDLFINLSRNANILHKMVQ